MDPIDVIVADIARSTLPECARGIVWNLVELVGGTGEFPGEAAAVAAVTDCLSVFLQVRASAEFGAASAKSLRKFGRAFGEFAGYADVRVQLLRPYRKDAGDAASMAAELERLWRANQDDLRLPQLPAGYWSRSLAEYWAAADMAILGNPLLEQVRAGNAPRRLTVLPEALQLLEQYFAADVNPPRPPSNPGTANG